MSKEGNMAETYAQAIKAARERYNANQDESAWDALRIADDFGRPLQVVCKEIAGDGWAALRSRAQRRANDAKRAGKTPEQRARAAQEETAKRERRAAKSVLKDPEQAAKVMASLTPTQLETAFQALSDALPKAARPSSKPAKRDSAKTRNIAAMAALADMHTSAQKAVEAVVFDELSEHQLASAEVMIRYTESEIAVWRENAEGSFSDEAIQAAMAEGV